MAHLLYKMGGAALKPRAAGAGSINDALRQSRASCWSACLVYPKSSRQRACMHNQSTLPHQHPHASTGYVVAAP